MTSAGRFAYAQTRLQARFGATLAPATSDQLHAARDLAGVLAVARATGLRHYVARLAPGLEPHQLERHLRDEWVGLVDEVAAWQPREWRATVRWLRWLPSLPLLQQLAHGGPAPAWARNDRWLGRVVALEPALRAAELLTTPLRPLHGVLAHPGRAVTAEWLAQWRALWPRQPPAVAALERIVRDVTACDMALRDTVLRDSREPKLLLRQRLQRTFRRYPLSPAAAIAFLALGGLDLLELRGQALRRAVLAAGPT